MKDENFLGLNQQTTITNKQSYDLVLLRYIAVGSNFFKVVNLHINVKHNNIKTHTMKKYKHTMQIYRYK